MRHVLNRVWLCVAALSVADKTASHTSVDFGRTGAVKRREKPAPQEQYMTFLKVCEKIAAVCVGVPRSAP